MWKKESQYWGEQNVPLVHPLLDQIHFIQFMVCKTIPISFSCIRHTNMMLYIIPAWNQHPGFVTVSICWYKPVSMLCHVCTALCFTIYFTGNGNLFITYLSQGNSFSLNIKIYFHVFCTVVWATICLYYASFRYHI